MTARAFLNSIADVLDAGEILIESWKGKLTPEQRDFLGAFKRYQTLKTRPGSIPPPRIDGFAPEEAPTKERRRKP